MSKNLRLRIFTGPNGSGKSTLYFTYKELYSPKSVFVNADILNERLTNHGFINLDDFDLKTNANDLENFKLSKESPTFKDIIFNFELVDNIIVNKEKNSSGYESAYIASFIRHMLLKENKSFSYETVMSHESKLQEIKNANEAGYKTYLYFVCTEDPIINISRVNNRVSKGGHDVEEDKVESRYYRALCNLEEALKLTYRTYIFDNSGKEQVMSAEVFQGKLSKIYQDKLPIWVDTILKNNNLL